MKTKHLIVFAVLTAAMIMTAIGAPAPAQAQTADPVIVGAGDIVTCGNNHDEQTANLIDNIPGTVVTLGDSVYPDNTAQQFADCYAPSWGRFKARTWPAPGNHEYHTAGAAGYFGYFGVRATPLEPNCTSDCKGYYSYNLGAWHVIVINSEIDYSPTSAQGQWLRADLNANPAACTLAYWHEPLFSSGKHGNASRIKPIWDVLYQYGVDVVLNGHDHRYERFAPQNPSGQADPKGIREFVVGTGGASLYAETTRQPNSEISNDTTWGVIKMTLHATSYDWEFVPVDGQTFRDSGSANCVTSGGVVPSPTTVSGPTPTMVTNPTATQVTNPTPTKSVNPTATLSRPPTATTIPGTVNPIFSNSFENGLTGWSAYINDKGDLSVTKPANISGKTATTTGAQFLIDDNTSIFVMDTTPNNEPRYRARFYFDPNSIKMGSGNAFVLFTGYKGTTKAVFQIEFTKTSAGYAIRMRSLTDAGKWVNSNWFTISDAVHYVEMDWRSANNTGVMTLWIDGTPKVNLLTLDNGTLLVDSVKLGAVSGLDTGTRGTFFIDDFVSQRLTYIGPVK